MGDEASSSRNSRREFLKRASLLAVSACALPVTAAASTTSIPRASAPTDLLEEFGYGGVQLAPGLPHDQFQHTQGVMLRMDIDSLLKPYRLRAGMAAPGPGMGGWYDLVSDDVRAQNKDPYGGTRGFAPGHSFGQWISALARGYRESGNPAARVKVEKILAAYEPAISGRLYANFPFSCVQLRQDRMWADRRSFPTSRAWSLRSRSWTARPTLPNHICRRARSTVATRRSAGGSRSVKAQPAGI